MSHAASYGNFDELKIGIVSQNPNQFQSDDLARLSRAYSKLLDIDVRIVKFSSLGSLMDAQGSANIHYGIHTTRSFVGLSSICRCIEPLVRPTSQNGSIGFRSVLVTHDASKSKKSDLKIGFSRKVSMSGGLLPKIAMDRGELPQAQLIELGSVENVVKAFMRKDIDGFFGWAPLYEGSDNVVSIDVNVAEIFGGFFNELDLSSGIKVQWSSQPVLYGPHAVHYSVPENLKVELKAILVNLKTDYPDLYDIFEPYFSGGFVPSAAREYYEITQKFDPEFTPELLADFQMELRPTMAQ